MNAACGQVSGCACVWKEVAVSEDSCVGGRRVSLDLVCAGASTTESVTGGVAGGGASETACDGVDDLAVHLSPGPVLSDLSASVCPLPLRVSPETRPWEPQTPNPVLRRSPNHW